MAINPKVEELKASLTILAAKIKAAAAKVRPTAFLADNADTLGGQNIAAVRTQLDGPLLAHTSNVNNPHVETAADIGIPLKTLVDAQLAKLIPSGVLPISNYGSQDYLPPNVAGSFEGGTTSSSPKITPMIIEGDGTLVYLRNGTNGSKLGVFYAYIKNALLSAGLTNPIKTNKKYHPPYFPVGKSAAMLLSWGDTALYGRLQDDATGALGDYFLSITNGTFDDNNHVGCIIPQANGGEILAGTIIAVGNTLYHFTSFYTPYTSPLEVEVRTIPLAAVVAGTATAWTRMSNFTTTGFSGTVSTPNIRLATVIGSTNVADKPLMLISGPTPPANLNFSHFDNPNLYAVADPVSGVIRVRWSSTTYCATTQGSVFQYVTFSFQFNPATKTASLDAGLTGQNGVNYNGAAVALSGPVYSTSGVYDAYPDAANTRLDRHISDAGYIFGIRIHQSIDTVDVTRVKINNFTTKLEANRFGATTSGNMSFAYSVPTFGTAIGGALVGAFPISLNKIATYSFGRKSNGASGSGMAWSALEGAPADFTYRSILNGSYKGWRPSTDRGFLADIGVADNSVEMPVVEVVGGTLTVTGYNFVGADMTGSVRSNRINADFSQGATTLTVSDAVLNAIALSAHAAVAGTVGALAQTSTQLVVPQVVGCPAFAVVHFYTTDGKTYFCVCRVAPTISGGAVTAASVSEVSPPNLYTVSGTGLMRYKQYMNQLGAIHLYDVGDAILVGVPSPIGKSAVGSSALTMLRFKYKKSQGKFVYPAGLGYINTAPLAADANCWFSHPALGFGMLTGDLGGASPNDFFTKLVFVPYATTEAEFDSWVAKAKTEWRVVASQDVPEGWMLYFTDPQPAFLAGQAYTLQPVNVNLMNITASPANKKFYIYVQLVLGIPKYVVRDTEINDSETTVYIGYVTTNSINIDQIVVSKVYRIGTFRLSNTPIGSAIPSSAGHPTDVGTLTWT